MTVPFYLQRLRVLGAWWCRAQEALGPSGFSHTSDGARSLPGVMRIAQHLPQLGGRRGAQPARPP
jgi:hypothetical protein